ncbi:c-type cytochrome [Lutimaribacter marinistellae]|uniref:C-type cytochrome n=1 Tax=Lutimaribacter marinistellae TaxID=1820329 RepID=A0ABV7TFJ1_9RHOB
MFDTMTVTKAAAGLFGAWLVLLLGKWAGETIYHVEAHGEPSYVIETAGAEETTSDEPEVSFEEMMAQADVEKGAGVFRKCSACHKVEAGENATGPYLHGVVGRDIAAVDGFGYSDALSSKEGAWTPEELSAFLENPRGYASGTSMSFSGLKKVEDRVNVIAYLDSLDD